MASMKTIQGVNRILAVSERVTYTEPEKSYQKLFEYKTIEGLHRSMFEIKNRNKSKMRFQNKAGVFINADIWKHDLIYLWNEKHSRVLWY
ncbi:hypothetical protein OUZ56_019856 [Daphnia magna]|uniref:Uncharacterized protein n=1 Tax=Daphnia magna TaxID=35525 RepID=A0ABQ9ZCT9_9CRUS|nr:hypothetical protein OUZ56_019856 [Daphnia magna]